MSIHLENRGITLFDADSRGGDATLVASVTDGTITVTSGDSGVAVSGNTSSAVTLTGSVAELNSLFRGDTTGTVIYTTATTKLSQLRFEENTGTNAADSSGNSRVGTLNNGATWVADNFGGYAVSLDGVDDNVSIGGSLSTAMTGNKLTVAAWVKPTTLVDFAKVFSCFVSTTARVEMGLSGAGSGENNDIIATVCNGTSLNATTAADIIVAGTWAHWAMVYDGAGATNSDKIKFYLNGVAQTLSFSAAPPSTLANLSSATARIGIRNTLFPLTGAVDDFRIYTSALSSTDVANIYNLGDTPGVLFKFQVTDEDGLSSTITFAGSVATLSAPVVTMPSATLTADVGVAFTLEGLTAWNITDADDADEYAVMTMSVTNGTLTAVTGISGATVTDGTFSGTTYLNSSDHIRLVGTITSLKNFLTSPDNSTLRDTAITTGSKTLTVIVTDGHGQISNTGTKTITVAQAPVVTPPSSFLAALTSGDVNIHGAGFSIADSDASGTQTMLLTTDTGRITVVAGTSGVTIGITNPSGGDATPASVSITGTLAQLNNLLQATGTGTIIFHKTTAGNSVFTVTVTDNTSRVGANTATIIMSATTTWTGFAAATPKAATATIAGFVVPIDLSKMPAAWWTAVTADGRDIRVTDASNNYVPRDLVHFSKTLNTGVLFAKITNSTAPGQLRIWVGASTSTAPTTGGTYGQNNTYDTTLIRAWWPDGGGNDRTSYVNHLTGFNSPTFGGETADLGFATSYLGSKYATTTVAVAASAPETFVSFVNPTDRTSETIAGSTRGTATNILQLLTSKVIARTIISVAATGAESTKKTATAVGDASKGAWQQTAASFLSESSRKAYRDGGNVGSDTNTQTGAAGTNMYMLGATVKNKTAGTVVERYFDGSIGLTFILAGISDSLVPIWLDNYKDAFDQTTYWGAWAYTAQNATDSGGTGLA